MCLLLWDAINLLTPNVNHSGRTYLVPVLFTFYIQGVLKLKKSGAKRLIHTAITDILVYVVKVYGGTDKIPSIVNIGTRKLSAQLHVPAI